MITPRNTISMFTCWLVCWLAFGCDEDPKNVSLTPDGSMEGEPTRIRDAASPEASTSATCKAEGFEDCVEKSRYVTDLEFIAHERTPGSEHWQAVQDLCADRFADLGYQVELQEYGSGVNVIGVMPGGGSVEEHVVISAHYDHIPDCAGADDNASGVAGVLEAARVLSSESHLRTLVVACWDEEELGLIGSSHYAQRASEQDLKIRVSYVFESIGFKSDEPDSQSVPFGLDLIFPEQVAELAANQNRGDFVTLIHDSNANEDAASLQEAAERIGLPVVTLGLDIALIESGLVTDLLRSDHTPFWLNQYPAILLTDSAEFRNSTYHCRDGTTDDVDTLDHDFATQIIQATVASAGAALSAPNP